MTIIVIVGFMLQNGVLAFLSIYCSFKVLIKTQYSVIIKYFRCDLGKEYISVDFSELLAFDGRSRQTSYINTSQQNGVAKRKYRHVVETTRSLPLFTKVPNNFGEKQLSPLFS